MKILPMCVPAIFFAAALTVHSQPSVHAKDGKSSHVFAVKKDLLAYEQQTPAPRRISSSGWVISYAYFQIWTDSGWAYSGRVHHIYNSDETGTSDITQYMIGGVWVNQDLDSISFDATGRLTTNQDLYWTSGAWAPGILDTFAYDANGYTSSKWERIWAGDGWQNSTFDTYTNDANGRPVVDVYQTWDNTGKAWVNANRLSYTYNSNGKKTRTIEEVWDVSGWVNFGQELDTFDGNGNRTNALDQVWNSGMWVNYTQNNYSYDANGHQVLNVYQSWKSDAWVNLTQWISTIDANGNKSDDVEQDWYKNAWRNDEWDQYTWQPVFGMRVSAPAQGERILAGSIYAIRWQASGSTSLKVDFSLDSGKTFQTIVNTVAASSNSYAWQVPDTMSAKCRIRITDANDSTQNAESGQFKIKPYILTRFTPNGDYEAFDLALHAWQFPNDSGYMWPQSWWRQFDYYFGTDPYTNKPYPPVFVFVPVLARASNFVDWPLFVKTFTPGVCYDNVSGAVYSPTALNLWSHFKDPTFHGSCFGFSQSSLLAFDRPSQFQAVYPEVGNFQNIHDRQLNDSLKNLINELYEHQYGYQHQLYNNAQYHQKDVHQTLDELKSYFLSDTNDHRGLSIIGFRGGHSVVPYKMVRRPYNDGIFDLDVYDNNCPTGACNGGSISTVVVIDSFQNSWNYLPLSWSGNGLGLFLDDPASQYLSYPILWNVEAPQVRPLAVSSLKTSTTIAYISIYNTISSAIIITDSTGQSIGFHDSVSNNLLDGIPIIPQNSFQQPPIGYFIPDGSYLIQTTSFTDSLAELSVLNQTGMFNYWRSDAVNNQTDRLSYNTGIAVSNHDPAGKSVNLEAITRLAGGERDFQILNCLMTQNDSVRITAPDSSRVVFVNMGSSTVYDLKIVLAGISTKGQFTHVGITIPANSMQYIVPNWPDLTQPVMILEDVGNTGTINDSILVSNQTTGVKESPKQGIPREFALEQNYPNPFNPTTTILYDLPQESHVTLRVYNVLGQEVAMLVNENKAPGAYTALWNAENVPSGVYFCRLTAGTFVQTRKLCLLR